MRANISAFDPAVKLPPSCDPIADIPPRLRDWYEAVFELGERVPPPLDISVPEPLADAPPPGEILVTLGRGRRIQVRRDPDLHLFDTDAGTPVALATRADAAVVYANRLYLRARDNLLEVRLHDGGTRVFATTRVAGRVHARATQLFPGVAVQSLLGATFVSLFVAPGRCPQARIPELDGYRVVDARLDRETLLVLAERGGVYDRLTIHFAPGFARHDVAVEPAVSVR